MKNLIQSNNSLILLSNTWSLHFLQIEVPSYSVGLVLEDYNLPYTNRAYFILKDTISIAYPISSKEIRCLVDVPGPKPPSISTGEMASYLKTVVAPQVCIVA